MLLVRTSDGDFWTPISKPFMWRSSGREVPACHTGGRRTHSGIQWKIGGESFVDRRITSSGGLV